MPRGGKRPGSGRKPSPEGTVKVPRAIKIKPELDAYLRQQPNATEVIEIALERSKAFKDWKKEQTT